MLVKRVISVDELNTKIKKAGYKTAKVWKKSEASEDSVFSMTIEPGEKEYLKTLSNALKTTVCSANYNEEGEVVLEVESVFKIKENE